MIQIRLIMPSDSVHLRAAEPDPDPDLVAEVHELPRIGETMIVGGERDRLTVVSVAHHARLLDSPQVCPIPVVTLTWRNPRPVHIPTSSDIPQWGGRQ